jgi:hypothetical protein
VLATVGDIPVEEPTANDLAQAKMDEAAIRRAASSTAVPFSPVGMLPTTTGVSIAGGGAERRVTITFTSHLPDAAQGGAQAASDFGSSMIRRLARDPTVASVEIAFSDPTHEIVSVRYDRADMNKVNWDEMSVRPRGVVGAAEFLSQSTSYQWSDKMAWREFVAELPSSERDVPISK